MIKKSALLVVSVVAFAGFAGCSDDDDGGGGGTGGTAGSAAGAGGVGGSAGSAGSGGSAGSAGTGGSAGSTAGTGGTDGGFGSDEQCASAPTKQECINCCGNTHPEGGPALLEITSTCVCKAAQCGNDCAQSLCANPVVQPTPGDACDTCFKQALDPGNNQGCASEIVANCQADTDCWAPFKCVEDRGCNSKPDADGGA